MASAWQIKASNRPPVKSGSMSIALALKKVRRGNNIVAEGMTVGGEARMALSVPVLAKALTESCHRFSDLAICNRVSAALSSATAPRKQDFPAKQFQRLPSNSTPAEFWAS